MIWSLSSKLLITTKVPDHGLLVFRKTKLFDVFQVAFEAGHDRLGADGPLFDHGVFAHKKELALGPDLKERYVVSPNLVEALGLAGGGGCARGPLAVHTVLDRGLPRHLGHQLRRRLLFELYQVHLIGPDQEHSFRKQRGHFDALVVTAQDFLCDQLALLGPEVNLNQHVLGFAKQAVHQARAPQKLDVLDTHAFFADRKLPEHVRNLDSALADRVHLEHSLRSDHEREVSEVENLLDLVFEILDVDRNLQALSARRSLGQVKQPQLALGTYFAGRKAQEQRGLVFTELESRHFRVSVDAYCLRRA